MSIDSRREARGPESPTRTGDEPDFNVTTAEFLERNAQLFGSPRERKFAEDVLGAVMDLNLESVSCQTSFQDAQGVPRRIDFTIEEGKHVRIAIEVDGWDKKGTKSGPTKGDWISDRESKLSITAHGYDLIEFPNALVRTKPTNCARLIELKLRTERRHDGHGGGHGGRCRGACAQ